MKKTQETKLHAIPHFPAGSFAVHIEDNLRFGIICGPIWGSFPVWGSFAALYNTPGKDNHFNYTSIEKYWGK